MAFTSNVRIFRNLAQPESLVNSYRLLVALELALKDGNCAVAGGGHDVPKMLVVAARLPAAQVFVSAQLLSFSQKLQANLGLITCQGVNGLPRPVPPHSYPYIRYGRRVGDWGGNSETPNAHFFDLELTCQNLCAFLVVHGPNLGVNL